MLGRFFWISTALSLLAHGLYVRHQVTATAQVQQVALSHVLVRACIDHQQRMEKKIDYLEKKVDHLMVEILSLKKQILVLESDVSRLIHLLARIHQALESKNIESMQKLKEELKQEIKNHAQKQRKKY